MKKYTTKPLKLQAPSFEDALKIVDYHAYTVMMVKRNTRLFDLHQNAFPIQGIAEDHVNALEDNQETDTLMLEKLDYDEFIRRVS